MSNIKLLRGNGFPQLVDVNRLCRNFLLKKDRSSQKTTPVKPTVSNNSVIKPLPVKPVDKQKAVVPNQISNKKVIKPIPHPAQKGSVVVDRG